ncbi:MAG TPA: cytochrome P450 [Stellaceae bacterium]|nr:cytochrome P450 [Stellaceae bacterium]HMD65616.1 cytochrome P450 [Stellaceae bacterium]
MTEAQPLVPATPQAPAGALSGRVIAKALRDNALLAFPPEAFEEEVVHRSFFGRRQIILNRPEGIHHILVENPDSYRRTPATMRMLRPLLGKGLLLSEGEDWKHQRRTAAPAFAPRTMPLLACHVARAAEADVARLAASSDRRVDLLAAMQSLALEIAGTSMFSLAMERYRPELRDLITRYTAGLGRPSLLDFLLPLAIPSPRDLARRRVRRRWVDLIGQIIAERRGKGSGEAPRDLFDLLSMARDPESGTPFSAEVLVDQVATMIAAGHETTGLALFWSLYLVAEAPAVQERLAAEVATVDLAPDHAAETLPGLVYTRAVVQEALRLYPPAFTIVRQARKPDNAGGIPVPAGAIVFMAPWVLHRHRRLWSRPEVFDPARFLPGAPAPDRFAYLPFGVGPRVCIGAQFALTEATLVLARMIQAFQIERADHEPVMPVAIVTTQPDHPPLFRVRPRR